MRLVIDYSDERHELDVEPSVGVIEVTLRGAALFGLTPEPYIRVTNNPIGCQFMDVSKADPDGPRVSDWCEWHLKNDKAPIFRLLTAADVEEEERDRPVCRHSSPYKAGHGYLCGWC